ncbi:MAG: hypothetical protein DI626_06770 [Micavibrio aeruginosavorus]|uniref:DUF2059 domain-containing protein n=1 Tax=Micavibrio aeruginosavorus TaxID=349221 RepID=A0A2W4ZYH2_9BACT|nr:MAG: hypothetical protein DI626_06770 [Micavibrio aeruginosavorus]
MMRFILTAFLAVLVIASPASAQDQGDQKTRLELAQKMHEIWPVRTRIESALESVSESFPEERRAEVKAEMRKAIQFKEVEEESIRAMADTFTAAELQAMIDFYGSETGRSISAKTADYEGALRPVLMRMMDKAMMALRTGGQ